MSFSLLSFGNFFPKPLLIVEDYILSQGTIQMDAIKFISERIESNWRNYIRDSHIRSLIIAFGVGGAMKRLLRIRVREKRMAAPGIPRNLEREAIMQDLLKQNIQAARNAVKLIEEITNGNRYNRARAHLKNQKLMLPPKQLEKALLAASARFMRYAYNLNQKIVMKVLTEIHGMDKYRKFLIRKGNYVQH